MNINPFCKWIVFYVPFHMHVPNIPKPPRYIKYIDCIRFMDYEYYLIPVTNGGCDVP